MIKKCEVVLRNHLVMVVLYGSMKIQLPTDKSNAPFVYIKKENNKYFLVDEPKTELKVDSAERPIKKNKKERVIETDLVDEIAETDDKISE